VVALGEFNFWILEVKSTIYMKIVVPY